MAITHNYLSLNMPHLTLAKEHTKYKRPNTKDTNISLTDNPIQLRVMRKKDDMQYIRLREEHTILLGAKQRHLSMFS